MDVVKPEPKVPADQHAVGMLSPEEAFPPRKPRLPHFRELDGIRGIAALMVYFHHVCFTSIHPQEWGTSIRGLYYFSSYGYTGVDLFFVLSGFLITSLLIQDRFSFNYYRNFYWKRALRILPLYTLCLICVYLFVPNSHGYVLMAALFVVNFAQNFHVATVGPFWTLAIEEQFYLLWPTVVRRRSVTQLTRWSVGVALCALVLRLAAASIGHFDYQLTFLRCDGLAIGAFIACLYSQRETRELFLANSTKWIGIAFVAGALCLALRFLPYNSQRELAFFAASGQTGISLLAGSIIAFAIVHTGAGYLAIFRSRFLTFFGLISYAFYLIHLYVLMAYDQFRGELPAGNILAYIVRFIVVLGITVALSLVTYYLIERPALSMRKYVLAPSSAKR